MTNYIKKLFNLLGCILIAGLIISCNTPTNGGPTATSVTGSSGVTFSTTYTEPPLPDSVGTDPFAGHTYSNTSGSNYIEFAFGNNCELTQRATQNIPRRWKYTYTYNVDSKELSLKYTHICLLNENEYLTYPELINYLVNLTNAQIYELSGLVPSDDAQKKVIIENFCNFYKSQFENIEIVKADLNSTNNLEISRPYYKTVPASFPNFNSYSFSTTSFNLWISSEYSFEKGKIQTYTGSNSKTFFITNITSNSITAEEGTSSSTGYTPVSGGITLQLSYSLALGNNNTLVITVTGSDDTTKEHLNTILRTPVENPTITAITSTNTLTFTLQS